MSLGKALSLRRKLYHELIQDKKTKNRERNVSKVQNADYGRVPTENQAARKTESKKKVENSVATEETVSVMAEDLLLEHLYELKSKVDELSAQVSNGQTTLTENIHTENVKTYRNIHAVLGEMDLKMAKADRLEKQVDSLRVYLKCTTWFSVTTLLVLVVYVLYTLGVF